VISEPRAVVLFESPRRVALTLRELAALAAEWPGGGERRVLLARELTKPHEEVLEFPTLLAASRAVARLGHEEGAAAKAAGRALGEFTLVVAPR
jgi:16S rRNA C1402 (ribose-2'-O) methylase RsmI